MDKVRQPSLVLLIVSDLSSDKNLIGKEISFYEQGWELKLLLWWIHGEVVLSVTPLTADER